MQVSQRQQSTAADLAIFRSDNNLFSLAEFMSQPGILEGFGVVATQFYSALKTNVDQYAAIDVATVMKKFTENVAEMFPQA